MVPASCSDWAVKDTLVRLISLIRQPAPSAEIVPLPKLSPVLAHGPREVQGETSQ